MTARRALAVFCVIGLIGLVVTPGYLPELFAASKVFGLLAVGVFVVPLVIALRRRPLATGHGLIAFGAALFGFLMFGLADVVPRLQHLSIAELLMTIAVIGGGVSAGFAIVNPEELPAPAH